MQIISKSTMSKVMSREARRALSLIKLLPFRCTLSWDLIKRQYLPSTFSSYPNWIGPSRELSPSILKKLWTTILSIKYSKMLRLSSKHLISNMVYSHTGSTFQKWSQSKILNWPKSTQDSSWWIKFKRVAFWKSPNLNSKPRAKIWDRLQLNPACYKKMKNKTSTFLKYN